MFEVIMSALLDPTSVFWKFVLVGLIGTFIGATAAGGWKQWIR
ncbi:hypothetical protein [Lacticaseibacillus paracasei]|nr:hypothetical protein [Lacticaseibacillus paracasei]